MMTSTRFTFDLHAGEARPTDRFQLLQGARIEVRRRSLADSHGGGYGTVYD